MTHRNNTSNSVTADDEAVDERVAGRFLGMTPSWLRKGRNTQTGPPFIRIGRNVRYLLKDLNAYREQHRVVPTARKRA
jgi:hypothetical protein